MPSNYSQRVANIQFNLKGTNAIRSFLQDQIKSKQDQLDIEDKLLKDAQELLKKEKEGTDEYKTKEKEVQKLEKAYNKTKKAVADLEKQDANFTKDINAVRDAIKGIGFAAPKTVDKLITGIKRMSKNIKLDTQEAIDKFEALQGVTLQVAEAYKDMFGKGIADMKNYKVDTKSWSELNAYVSEFTRNGRRIAEVFDESDKALQLMGKNATDAKVRIAEMEGVIKNTGTANKEELVTMAQFYKSMQTSVGATKEQVADFKAKYDETMRTLANKHMNVLAAPGSNSIEEIEASIQWLTKYQREAHLTTKRQDELTESINKGKLALKERVENNSLVFMKKQFKDLTTISADAVVEQKKFWQAVASGKGEGNVYNEAIAKVKAINEELERRNNLETKRTGVDALRRFNQGVIAGSTTEIQKNIDALTKWRGIIDQSAKPKLFNAVDNAVRELNKRLVEAQENVQLAKRYMDTTDSGNTFKGTIQDLEKVRSGLVDMRKKLVNAGDTSGLARIDAKLLQVDNDIRTAGIDATKLRAAIDNPKGEASLKVLQVAYDKLKAEINQVNVSQEKFNENAAKMKNIQGRINELTNAYKYQNEALATNKTMMASLATNLKNIVLHYVGLQMIMMRIFAIIKDNVKIADQMTNISKVTGIASEEVTNLTRSIYDIDTRTANDELMQLAEQAGKLGIATRAGAAGVKSFVEVGNMVTNTLGDIGGAEAITELLKVNDVINENRQGIERDLNSIGSAVLNVGNNSKATYKAVTEFTKRMGPVAQATHLSMQEVMGLGGAFSSLGTDAAQAATATQRVMMGMVNNIEGVAKILNLNTADMMDKIDQGKTFEVFLEVLGRLGTSGTEKMEKFFKVLGGRYNMQARSAITLLSQHVSELQYQVNLANEGFADGEMVEREYEKANNNLAGTIDRITNQFQEMFTSLQTDNGLFNTIAKSVLALVKGFRNFGVSVGSGIFLLGSFAVALWSATKAAYANATATAVAEGAFKGFRGTLAAITTILTGPFRIAFYKIKGDMESATIATNNFKMALASIGKTTAVLAIMAVASAIYSVYKEQKRLREEQQKYIDASKDELNALSQLKRQIEDVNTPMKRRNDLITEFNKKAGQYLSHMVTEAGYAKQIAIAYNEAATAIHKKNKEAAIEEGNRVARETSMPGRASADTDLRNAIRTRVNSANSNSQMKNALRGLDDVGQDMLASNAEAYLSEYFEGADNPQAQAAINTYRKKYGATANGALAYLRFKMGSQFSYETSTSSGRKKMNALNANGAGDKTIYNALKSYADNLEKGEVARQPYANAAKVEGVRQQRATDSEMNEIYTAFFDSNGNMRTPQGYNSSERYKMINQYLNYKRDKEGENYKNNPRYKNMVNALNALTSSDDFPWGQPETDNLADMNKEELAEVLTFFDNLGNPRKNQKYIKPGSKHGTTLQIPAGVKLPDNIESMDKRSIQNWALAQWRYWYNYQKEVNGANTSGHFIPESKGGHKDKFDVSDSAMAELDRYYSWLDEQEKNRLAKNEITQAEYNRRQLKNEEEHHEKRAELMNYYDGKKREEFIAWWNKTTELEKVAWENIDKEWAEADEKKRKENRRNAQRELTTRENMLAEHTMKINKLLLETNPTDKVLESLRTQLDELDLLTGNMFDDDKIIQQLRPVLADIANLTEKELMERLSHIPTIGKLITGDTAETMRNFQSYLLKLTEGSEQYLDALRKEAEREKKRIDLLYKNDGDSKRMQGNLADLKVGATTAAGLQSLGLGSEQVTADAKVKVAQQELVLAQHKYEFELKDYNLQLLKLKTLQMQLTAEMQLAHAAGDKDKEKSLGEQLLQAESDYQDMKTKMMYATEATRQDILEKQNALDIAEKESIETRLANIKEYMSSVEQFGTSMTEAAFGTKEDRQNAAKELLRSVLETTKKIMLAKMEELIFERSIQAQKVAVNNTAQDQITSATASSAMKNVTISGAEAIAGAEAGMAGGSGKTIGQLGYWGIPLVAVISAVLGSLIAAVMGSMNKAKNTISAQTGKMSSTMLTYAKGRYPTYADGTMGTQTVQGNDGHSYHAVVKPNLTTGEYSRPHLGIVGEKGAEVIIDHPTFSGLKQRAPWVLSAIYNMKRFGTTGLNYGAVNRAAMGLGITNTRGRSKLAAIPTHADGNIEDALAGYGTSVPTDAAPTADLTATLTALTIAIQDLQQKGVQGHFSTFGDGGLVDSYDRGKAFLNSVK